MASTVFEDKLTKQSLIDLLRPVGSIYMSAESTNPETLFSGTTWEQINNAFLVGAGSIFSAGVSGGQSSVSFTASGTVNETAITEQTMPSHSHTMTHTHSSDGYKIDQNAKAHTHNWIGYWTPVVSGYVTFAARDADSGSLTASSILEDGAHSHTIQGTSGLAHIGSNTSTGEVYTSSYGGGLPHSHGFNGTAQTINTVPPYLSVNIWKRIA